MKTINSKWWAGTALVLMVIIFAAWRSDGGKKELSAPYTDEDTVRPRKKTTYHRNDIRISDLDEAMRELDRAMVDMDKNIKFDMGKMDKEIKQALEEIKNIDFDKISKEINASLKEINWEKTRAEVNKALHEAEIKIKEVDMKKVKEEMANMKENIDAQKILSHIDVDAIKKSVESGMSAARIGIEAAKKEIGLLKEFIDTLDKDGLIDKKKDYRIQVKDGELYINGTKQSKEINDKYKKYYKDRDEDFSITSDGEGSVRI